MAGKHMERKAGNEMMEEQGTVSMGDTCPCWLMVKTRIFAKYGLKHSVRYFNLTQQCTETVVWEAQPIVAFHLIDISFQNKIVLGH